MKLTGQAKEKFEEWFIHKSDIPQCYDDCFVEFESVLDTFYNLPESMQWGVYQDFADSLGYDLKLTFNVSLQEYFAYLNKKLSYDDLLVWSKHKTRQEARNAAIEKLNQIINEG